MITHVFMILAVIGALASVICALIAWRINR